jgi:SAM-dependent methyltransferase
MLTRFKVFLKRTPLWKVLAPGYPDTARLLAQEPVFRAVLRDQQFGGVCLNAGCGEGLYSLLLESLPNVTQIENIDIASPSHLANVRTDSRNRFVQGSLTNLPYPSRTFNSCLCSEVIEHIPNHKRAVQELARVLKPGGLLLASVPQSPAPWDPAHVRQGYTFAEFEALLEGEGFRIIARRDCFYLMTRVVMWYWRRPWLRFGTGRCPYLPRGVVRLLALLDRPLSLGKPWDLVILAARK